MNNREIGRGHFDIGLCPECNSHSINGESFDFNKRGVSQELSCSNCDCSWKDVFSIVLRVVYSHGDYEIVIVD